MIFSVLACLLAGVAAYSLRPVHQRQHGSTTRACSSVVCKAQPPPSLQQLLAGATNQLASLTDSKVADGLQQTRRSPQHKNSRSIWVVCAKRAVDDQVTVDLASTVHAAVCCFMRASRSERPSIIMFCGADLCDTTVPTDSRSLLNGATLALHFFRTCSHVRHLDMSDVKFVLEDRSATLRDGVVNLALEVRQQLRATDSSDFAGGFEVRFFSSEHHLQRISDVENLLPRLSPLRPLHALQADVSHEPIASPFAFSTDAATSRLARHACQAQQLQMLQLNLAGIERGEFLEPKVWQQALSVRATLASELLDEAGTARSSKRYEELRELEISVGCLAHVEKALQPLTKDPLRGSIAARELRDASMKLHAAICSLRSLDPDLPLTPQQWMRLVDGPSPKSGDRAMNPTIKPYTYVE